MSIELSDSGFTPGTAKKEQVIGMDLEQNMQAMREAIQFDSTQRNEQMSKSQQIPTVDIAEAAEAFAAIAQNMNRDLRFTVDNELEQPIIKVIDRSTGDIIRQIPTEEVVQLAVKIRQLNSDDAYDSATGLLIDSRV